MLTPQELKTIRGRTGLNQPDFARLIGYHPNGLAMHEQGRRRPRKPFEVLLRLIDKAGKTRDEWKSISAQDNTAEQLVALLTNTK